MSNTCKPIVILLLTLFSGASFLAQETERPYWEYTVLSGGAGASLAGTVLNMKLQTGGLFFGRMQKKTNRPVYAGNLDKRVSNIFGFGLGYSYESFETESENFSSPFLGPTTGPERITDSYTRSNYALRGILFMGKTTSLDSYFALRVGYTIWTHSSTSADENYIKAHKPENSVSMQLAYGLRYFFNTLGLGFEVGLGSAPYYFLATACLKFD